MTIVEEQKNTGPIALPKRLPLTDDPKVRGILSVHYSLWQGREFIEHQGQHLPVHKPAHGGYSSIVVPSENGYNFLWITQNMNKETYGSMAIRRARQLGDDKMITWIVDNNASKFAYVGSIHTTHYFNGDQDVLIERYVEGQTEVVYTNMPFYFPAKSKY
jgi:hypothetical protein